MRVWVLLFVYGCMKEVNGQGASPAKVAVPNVLSVVGAEASLSCSSSDKGSSELDGNLRFCVWERLQQDKSAHTFIVNFNEINSQPGLYSGTRGYSYSGEGFKEGECGVKISFVKVDDFAKWQCTLITDDKVYRGYVTLEKETPPTTTQKPAVDANKTSAVAFSRTAIDENNESNINRARPIITSYNDARAVIQPEIVFQSASGGAGLIQEVKVESAGLQIKPRRQGKLIVFERK